MHAPALFQTILSRSALVVAFGFLLVAAACGGGGDDEDDAQTLVADLDDLGFAVVDEGELPVKGAEVDSYRWLYADAEDPSRQVLTVVWIEESEEMAEVQFGLRQEMLRNPSAEFFGYGSTPGEVTEAPALDIGESHVSYVTAKADRQGNMIWTDMYKSGRVVFLVQVLGQYDVEQTPTRTLVAERILSGID